MNSVGAGMSVLVFSAVLGTAAESDTWERQLLAGRALASRASYEEARKTLEEARRQAAQFGPSDVRLATVLNDLGTVYLHLDEIAPAARCLRASAEIWKARGDALHALTPLTNLAGAYLARSQYTAAESSLHDALALATEKLGPEDPQTVAILTYLADSACLRRDYDAAARLAGQVVDAVRHTHRPGDPVVATALDNLGTIYRAQRRLDDSSRLFEEAVGVLEKSGQPDNPAWIRALDDYSIVFFDRGRFEDADALLVRSLALAERTLGPDHPDVARVLAHRAMVLRKAGRKSEARELEARSARIEEKSRRENALGFTIDVHGPEAFRQGR